MRDGSPSLAWTVEAKLRVHGNRQNTWNLNLNMRSSVESSDSEDTSSNQSAAEDSRAEGSSPASGVCANLGYLWCGGGGATCDDVLNGAILPLPHLRRHLPLLQLCNQVHLLTFDLKAQTCSA